MTPEEIQEALADPMPPPRIGWEFNGEGVSVMDRLDRMVGIANWQDSYEVRGHGVIVHRIAVRVDGAWLWRDARGWGVSIVEYRDVPGFPGYLVGADGSVWSRWQQGRWGKMNDSWRRLKTPQDNHGYLQVNLSNQQTGRKQHFKVYALVLLVFVGRRPDGLCIRHLDGNRANNSLRNLAYGTYAENAQDTIRHGRAHRGERHRNAKLDASAILEVRRRVAAGEQQKRIAAELGVNPSTVCDIIAGRTWAHVTEELQ